jgi:hypothetical protein
MNKILKLTVLTSLLLIGVATSCNLPVLDSQKETETPAKVSTLTATPTEFVPPASATPELAPLCALGVATVSPPAQCQTPIAEESSAFCVKKKAYNLILINKGAVYKATEGFKCSDNGVKNGRQMVTCTGTMASYFEVKVCDSACLIPTVQAKSVQCPPNYNYNGFQGCCTQEFLPTQQNCVTLKLKTTSCSVNCNAFAKKATCNKNSNACIWDSAAKACELRK